MKNLQRYEKDLEKLIDKGMKLSIAIWSEFPSEGCPKYVCEYINKMGWNDPNRQEGIPSFRGEYQSWYSEASVVVGQLLRERLEDFRVFYQGSGENYMLVDYLAGNKSAARESERMISLFEQQLAIVKAASNRLESSLFDIKQLVQADLFDSELEAAKELLDKGFLRPAGVVAGAVMEKHLAQVCENHAIKFRKKKLTLNDFNDSLKEKGVINVPDWRSNQRLGDLRNLCAHHNKGNEVTKEQVAELIDSVAKLIKTLS